MNVLVLAHSSYNQKDIYKSEFLIINREHNITTKCINISYLTLKYIVYLICKPPMPRPRQSKPSSELSQRTCNPLGQLDRSFESFIIRGRGGGGVRCSAREIIHWHQGVGIVKVRKYVYLKSEASVWQKFFFKNKHFKCYKCKTFERCIWVVTIIIFKFIHRYAFYFNSSLHHNFAINGKLISLLYWSINWFHIYIKMSQIYQSMQCTVSSYSKAHNIRNPLYDSWLIKTIHKSKCIIYHWTYYVCSLVDDCWY